MSVTVTLPEVSACAASECTYNADQRCHAPAITIGDGLKPACDTFMRDDQHVAPQPRAGVGACKVSVCVYNRERTCNATSIDVQVRGATPDCATFRSR